jgi:hypothetical protein
MNTTDVSSEKPKKVLTEAQRLAFLKGREKRMANIERKRQEKIEATGTTAEPELPTIAPEPKKTRPKKEKKVNPPPPPPPLPLDESTQETDDDDYSDEGNEVTETAVKEEVKTEPPVASKQETLSDDEDEYHQQTAERIAGYLFDHIRKLKPEASPPSQLAHPTVPDAPIKRKYERQAKSTSPAPPPSSKLGRKLLPPNIQQTTRPISWM